MVASESFHLTTQVLLDDEVVSYFTSDFTDSGLNDDLFAKGESASNLG